MTDCNKSSNSNLDIEESLFEFCSLSIGALAKNYGECALTVLDGAVAVLGGTVGKLWAVEKALQLDLLPPWGSSIAGPL